jgi:hypothetical protein
MGLFLGQAVLAQLLTSSEPMLSGARLNPGRPLPYSLDIYGLSVRCRPRTGIAPPNWAFFQRFGLSLI